jgi:O-succinylbenzoic acid--CoA ligase
VNWLIRQAEIRPDATALRVGPARISWSELVTRTERIAAALQIAGLRPGARVAALASNGPHYVALVHAAMWAGTTLVPLNPKLPDETLSWQLRDSHADLLVVDHGAANRSLSLGPVRFVQIEELTYSGSAEPAPVTDDATATILYTSGTSGEPKPVRLTWANHAASATASALNLGLHRDDDWLCCLPMYHVGGLSIALRTAMYGTRMTLLEEFDVDSVLEALRSDVTLVSVVPTMLRRLAERTGGPDGLAAHVAAGKLRAILVGGGPVSADYLSACHDAGLPVIPTYGMTETASQIATLPPDRSDKIGAAGYPVWGAEISIRDADGEPVKEGPGIVWVRGPMVTSGYVDRPDVNRRRFVGGWFRTGDRGVIAPDGFLHILGRHDDVIVTGGENVSPGEVERVIAQHSGVSEVAIFGVADDEWGEVVCAAVVTDGTVSRTELDEYCRDRLAGHQRPRKWVALSSLPRTSTGKIRRAVLRERHG